MLTAATRAHSFLAALLGACLCACAYAPANDATADNFPVVEPFAIDRAGSKMQVEFELPDVGEDGRLRPVYVGFRGVEKIRKFSPEELQASMKVTDYMQDAPIPVRLRVWRWNDNGQKEQVVLHQIHVDMKPPHKFAYHPVRGDVVTRHGAASMDYTEMMAAGHFDDNKIYYFQESVRIIPPTPGRYLLEAESLETHPILHVLQYELIVSHYYQKGIW